MQNFGRLGDVAGKLMAEEPPIGATLTRRQLPPERPWRPEAGVVLSITRRAWPAPPTFGELEREFGVLMADAFTHTGAHRLVFHHRATGVVTVLEFDAFAVER
mgnify:CR=1 FL=1